MIKEKNLLDIEPSVQLYNAVRGAFVTKGLSLSNWAIENNAYLVYLKQGLCGVNKSKRAIKLNKLTINKAMELMNAK